MFLDCILNFLHSASATFKMEKFHVVSGSDNGSFQGALQYAYNDLIKDHIIKDIRYFITATGYSAILIYSDLKGENNEDSIYA